MLGDMKRKGIKLLNRVEVNGRGTAHNVRVQLPVSSVTPPAGQGARQPAGS